ALRARRRLGSVPSFVSCGLLRTGLAALAPASARSALAMLAITAVARLMLHSATRYDHSGLAQLWVLPLTDLLVFTLWCWGFVTRRVQWRHARYRVARDGSAHPIP